MRPTPLLVLAGGLAVLAMLVALWRMTRMTEPAATERTALPEAELTPTAAAPPGAAGPTAPSARARRPIDLGGPRPRAADDRRDTPAPAVPAYKPAPATRDNTTNLHYGVAQMRAQIAAVEPQVRACVERAAAAGHRPTGHATLTFIAVQQRDRVVIEDTGVVHDKSTLEDDALLDCLRETSRAMKFEGLPREAEGVVVSRRVAVAGGELTENGYVSFSYLR